MYKDYSVAVVIPAYNEERLIGKTLEAIPGFIDKVIVINDASTDETGATLKANRKARFTYIEHPNNLGVGAAISSGYRQACMENADIAVVMAGDNQMDPQYITKLLDPIVSGQADYTKGDRLSMAHNRQGMSQWRKIGNYLLTQLTRIAAGNWKINDPQNGFTAISKSHMERINIRGIYSDYGYCNDILVKLSMLGSRIIDVPIPARYGQETSKIVYSRYIPKVSLLLFKALIWRLNKQLEGRTIENID
jgi:glycosyltransferase involved in cell wall biosynthesis